MEAADFHVSVRPLQAGPLATCLSFLMAQSFGHICSCFQKDDVIAELVDGSGKQPRWPTAIVAVARAVNSPAAAVALAAAADGARYMPAADARTSAAAAVAPVPAQIVTVAAAIALAAATP